MNKYFRNIKAFDLGFDDVFKEKFYAGCANIFDEAYLTNHTYVNKFEKAIASYVGSKFALATCNGTGALETILRALNVKNKDVLLPSNTFIATSVAILNAGGKPVPVDIESKFLGISSKKVEKLISKSTGAVVLVHIGGLISPETLKLKEICSYYGVPLVEDAAQSFGSTLNNIKAGSFGIAGSFSFFLTKVLTTGEGGLIVTDEEELYFKMKSVRQFGMDNNNSISHITDGSNFKMSEFSALLGILDLERFELRVQKRRRLAERYQENLRNSKYEMLVPSENATSTYYKQIIISPISRDRVEKSLKEKKINLTGGVYKIPLHRQPVYLGKHDDRNFPVCNNFSEKHICPPCYPELEVNDIDLVCRVLLEIL
jgi:perosamine synthetase